jgi:hypothetical protein
LTPAHKPDQRPKSRRWCSICSCDFDIEAEEGTEGDIGILPVAFCPTCRVGILDFADQQSPGFDCPHCGEYIGE